MIDSNEYYYLKEKDVIQDGDEWCEHSGLWHKVIYAGFTMERADVGLYRRHIKPTESEWYYLKEGDRIKYRLFEAGTQKLLREFEFAVYGGPEDPETNSEYCIEKKQECTIHDETRKFKVPDEFRNALNRADVVYGHSHVHGTGTYTSPEVIPGSKAHIVAVAIAAGATTARLLESVTTCSFDLIVEAHPSKHEAIARAVADAKPVGVQINLNINLEMDRKWFLKAVMLGPKSDSTLQRIPAYEHPKDHDGPPNLTHRPGWTSPSELMVYGPDGDES